MFGRIRLLVSGAVLAFTALHTMAAGPLPAELAGAADPAGIKRFTGATLIGYKHEAWASVSMPTSAQLNQGSDKGFKDTARTEGEWTRAVYLTPEGKAPAEVFRNYEQALSAAGLKKKFSCENKCDELYFALDKRRSTEGLVWAKGQIPDASSGAYPADAALTFNEGRLLVGTLPRGGVETWVLVYVSRAVNSNTRHAQAFVETLAPKAMQGGQVQVLSSADIQTGLASEGKVAFYGVYFDSGKAELKAESRDQIGEMGKLLKSQPKLQVFVVGHTDNQGQFDANLQLSQQRAQAVVDALVKDQGIEARRLIAKGVANLSPLASNAGDAGRARNRRVELVVR